MPVAPPPPRPSLRAAAPRRPPARSRTGAPSRPTTSSPPQPRGTRPTRTGTGCRTIARCGATSRPHRQDPLVVQDEEQEPRHDERAQEDVEHRHPALDDVESVEGEEQRGQSGPPDRAPQTKRQEIEDPDAGNAEQHRGQPPAERMQRPDRADPEERDHPLAHRGVHPRALVGDGLGRALADRLADTSSQVRRCVEDVVLLVPVLHARRGHGPGAEAGGDHKHGDRHEHRRPAGPHTVHPATPARRFDASPVGHFGAPSRAQGGPPNSRKLLRNS